MQLWGDILRSYSKLKQVVQNLYQHPKQTSRQKNPANTYKEVSPHLGENEKYIKEMLGTSDDVLITPLTIAVENDNALSALLVAIDGLVDEEAKRNDIIKPLKRGILKEYPAKRLQEICSFITVKQIKYEENLTKAMFELMQANVLLFVDGFDLVLVMALEGFEVRSIQEPETEQTVRGSREGFIEAMAVNVSLIRRRIAHPSLRFETFTIGEISQTKVAVAYVAGIADQNIVNNVKQRLKRIDVDSINTSGDIEQFIEDHPYSIFSTIGNTERPDTASTLLMEGRIVILISGNPVALYVPYLFIENFKTIEDYNSRPYYASFVRLLRFFAFFISIALPGIYISALNFNKGLIPSGLIVPIIQARETVPFPLVMEVILMILLFEVVREAGVRLPKQIGAALSIIGALILGEISVSAGLVGAPTIVIVSGTFMATFVITPIADVSAILRLYLLSAASIFGTYGLVVALLGLMTHMISLTSLGVPYMAPLAPTHLQDWKDLFIRLPLRNLTKRLKSVPNKRPNRVRSLPDTGEKE